MTNSAATEEQDGVARGRRWAASCEGSKSAAMMVCRACAGSVESSSDKTEAWELGDLELCSPAMADSRGRQGQ